MRFYHFSSVELVRIGTGRALIKEITRQQVSYTDEAGRAMHVDLEECARIYHCLQEIGQFPPGDDTDWARLADTFPNFSAIDVSLARCVGLRAVLDEPPWFQFLNRRRTQFEFTDYEHIQAELRVPLGHVGWSSWDASYVARWEETAALRDFRLLNVRFGSFTSFPPSRRVRFAPKSRHCASARVYEYTP